MLQLNRGEAIRHIVGEFEELGYRWAYRVIDSRAFGLPQRRQRVFLVASTEIDPANVLLQDDAVPTRDIETPLSAYGFYWTEGSQRPGLGGRCCTHPQRRFDYWHSFTTGGLVA